MKCIPITLSGLSVTAAICVIEIDDVLVAKIVSTLHKLSKSVALNVLKYKFDLT